MCGRYTIRSPLAQIADRFGLRIADLHELFTRPRFNVAPSQIVPALRVEADAQRHLVPLKWGFVPSWSRDGKIAPTCAVGETIAAKPMFRNAFKQRRCLLIADGFYEWRVEGKKKLPVHFRLRSGEPFAFAGVWEAWHDPIDDQTIETTAIITTTPNEVVKPVHPTRMPVILRSEYYDEWLDPKMADADRLTALFQAYPADEMEAVAANPYVNTSKNEGPECLAPPA
jgi:putative SOS response-associated peptidase YedK